MRSRTPARFDKQRATYSILSRYRFVCYKPLVLGVFDLRVQPFKYLVWRFRHHLTPFFLILILESNFFWIVICPEYLHSFAFCSVVSSG